MWSEEEGKCVGAWLTPDDELYRPASELATKLETGLAKGNYGEHAVNCGTEELHIFVGAEFTCTSVKSVGSTHTINLTIIQVADGDYNYDAVIDDHAANGSPPTPTPTTAPTSTVTPPPAKPKLKHTKKKASLKKFCNTFQYSDVFNGSGKINKTQAENILLMRDYEGGKHLYSSASKSLRRMARYALEFYDNGNYSHRAAYKKDLKNMSGWAGELCVEF
jgi:hypothetical protein